MRACRASREAEKADRASGCWTDKEKEGRKEATGEMQRDLRRLSGGREGSRAAALGGSGAPQDLATGPTILPSSSHRAKPAVVGSGRSPDTGGGKLGPF